MCLHGCKQTGIGMKTAFRLAGNKFLSHESENENRFRITYRILFRFCLESRRLRNEISFPAFHAAVEINFKLGQQIRSLVEQSRELIMQKGFRFSASHVRGKNLQTVIDARGNVFSYPPVKKWFHKI